MWILLCLVVLAHAEQVPLPKDASSRPTQHDDEIAFLRSEILHIKNAVWGILYGLNDPAARGKTETEITMGFRDRYTSPYGEDIRKNEEELTQRRLRLFEQCIVDSIMIADRYPEGSNIVKINCDDVLINQAAELQLQQERAYADLAAALENRWKDMGDSYDEPLTDEEEQRAKLDQYYDA